MTKTTEAGGPGWRRFHDQLGAQGAESLRQQVLDEQRQALHAPTRSAGDVNLDMILETQNAISYYCTRAAAADTPAEKARWMSCARSAHKVLGEILRHAAERIDDAAAQSVGGEA